MQAFKGIPFAAPPVGKLRWKAPQPAAAWEGVRDCFDYGPGCPQRAGPMMAMVPMAAIKSYNEDCLTLNVFRPAAGDKKLPVMVWIHGGGYDEGEARYNLRLREQRGHRSLPR